MRILGLDPGSNATGYGIVDRAGSGVVHVAHGVVRSRRGTSLPERLAFIHSEVVRISREHSPDLAVVEKVFVAASAQSALVLGHARGAALAALAAERLEISELAARQVKKGVVGTGSATKAQVQDMVVRILKLEDLPPSDAADALAMAISQAHAGPLAKLGASTRRRRRRFTEAEIAARSGR